MACKKYTVPALYGRYNHFEHNDFIYNMVANLCKKAYEMKNNKKIYLSEKQYYCLSKYAEFDGRKYYYITHDKKYQISIYRGTKRNDVYYYGACNIKEEINHNLNDLISKDDKAIGAVTVQYKNGEYNSFCIIDLEYLEDLKEDEKDGDLKILKIQFKNI